MSIKAPQLTTDRLTLDDISEIDTDLIVKWRSNPQVYKYFLAPHPINKEEHLKWLRNSYMNNSNILNYMAVVKATGERIGVFGIKRDDEKSISAEVSYILAPEAQGRGYASEAIRELMVFIKAQWHCRYAVAEIHIENLDSIHFAERLGFAFKSRIGEFSLFEKKL